MESELEEYLDGIILEIAKDMEPILKPGEKEEV